jgi:hypothetical protein
VHPFPLVDSQVQRDVNNVALRFRAYVLWRDVPAPSVRPLGVLWDKGWQRAGEERPRREAADGELDIKLMPPKVLEVTGPALRSKCRPQAVDVRTFVGMHPYMGGSSYSGHPQNRP